MLMVFQKKKRRKKSWAIYTVSGVKRYARTYVCMPGQALGSSSYVSGYIFLSIIIIVFIIIVER